MVGWIYVGRNIVARITALGGSMRAIAEGDLKTEVPIEGRDEITEMAKALLVFRDTAIEVEEANAEAIIDNTLAGLVATNRLGVIEFFNPSAEALFGYPSSEIVGRDLTTLIHEEFRDQVKRRDPPFTAIRSGKRASGLSRNHRSCGPTVRPSPWIWPSASSSSASGSGSW